MNYWGIFFITLMPLISVALAITLMKVLERKQRKWKRELWKNSKKNIKKNC